MRNRESELIFFRVWGHSTNSHCEWSLACWAIYENTLQYKANIAILIRSLYDKNNRAILFHRVKLEIEQVSSFYCFFWSYLALKQIPIKSCLSVVFCILVRDHFLYYGVSDASVINLLGQEETRIKKCV